MSGPHDALCINSFYPETELNVTEIQEYECIKELRSCICLHA